MKEEKIKPEYLKECIFNKIGKKYPHYDKIKENDIKSNYLELNNGKKFHYKALLEWLKSLSDHKRWDFIIELIIDIKFIEYDESKPCCK